MQFESANPTVIKSIKQRELLNAWLRALGKGMTLPVIADYRPDLVADELADMMGFDIEGEGDEARFLITQEGARLAATYGNEQVDTDKSTNRYLDCAVGPTHNVRGESYGRSLITRKQEQSNFKD